MDIEETQTLETTEIIEEQPTEVNENKYIKNHTSFKKKISIFNRFFFFFHNFLLLFP